MYGLDFIAAFFELSGTYNLGSKRKIGFIFNVIGSVLWIIVALLTHVYGLLLVVIPGIFLNIRGFVKWKEQINKQPLLSPHSIPILTKSFNKRHILKNTLTNHS